MREGHPAWRVRTGSRLHLGLLSLPGQEESGSVRRFGGVGLMIDAPGLSLRVEDSRDWSAEGPLAQRALGYAALVRPRVERALGSSLPPRRLIVEHAPSEHVGLGTGTQLGLAVAASLLSSWGIQEPAARLASLVDRGRRSALGIHGFERGGFLVEAGKRAEGDLSPLVVRLDVPARWRVLLVILPTTPGLHGEAERSAFARLAVPSATRDLLCRLVLLGMLPALAEEDEQAFGEAVHEFNARVGEAFAPIQGGRYANPRIEELIGFLRAEGVPGVGQSSWGPGVFAIVGDEGRAVRLSERVRDFLADARAEVHLARAMNEGARLS